MRFLMAYQAAVEDDAEDNRFATRDHLIQPFGTEYAAEICGRTGNYMRNTLNPFNETNPAGLKEFFRLVANGLDKSVIDALLKPRRLVAIRLADPSDDPRDDSQIAQHLVFVSKEIGDIAAIYQQAISPDSPKGQRISRKEREALATEILEAAAALMVVLGDVEGVPECR